MTVEFWRGARRLVHDVPAKWVEDCYALPRKGAGSDRSAYWCRVTGDASICGHVLVWAQVEPRRPT